jgi:putative Mn2+ efflux pump MntP
MTLSPLPLLVLTAGAVGVLHTIVPDHWAPIAIIARNRRWSQGQTARAAAIAGLGHTVSTLLIGAVAWAAGALAAQRFGRAVDIAAGIALVVFGLWTTIAGVRELREPLPQDVDEAERALKRGHSRTALLLIVGSSPSVEVLPAFFAASPLGVGALLIMAIVFAVTTIGTYVVTCVVSAAGLSRLGYPAIERYGEVISGVFVTAIGLVFLIWFRP